MLVNISPEHARLATIANKQIAFVVWSILRDDIRANVASGHYSKSDVKNLCASFNYTTRTWTRIFKSGEGIFWGNDDKLIHIRSMKYVTKTLQKITARRIDVRDKFKVHVMTEFEEGDSTAETYAKLYWAWFRARGEVEISRDEIQSIFELSHAQQRAYEKILGKKMIIRSNYCLIDRENYQSNPDVLPEHHSEFSYERVTSEDKVVTVNAIQYQLPNSYIATNAGNADSGTTTAPQSLVRANSARLWYARYPHKQNQLYYTKQRDFERFGNEQSYMRVYYQGKKRLWLRGQYL